MRKGIFLLLCMLICCVVLSLSAFAAEPDSVLSVRNITMDEEKLCFDIDISNESISYESAYTVVTVYDKDGGMIETSNQPVTYDEKEVSLEVVADLGICSYQVMLLSSDGNLKPFCASVKAEIDINELNADNAEAYNQNIELLSAMDIINVNGLENADSSHTVTGAEFAAVLCRTMDLELEAEAFRKDEVFEDVTSDHWAAGYINFLAQGGIIDGVDGKYMPDEAISYDDALKAIVYALGYEPMETVMGGYKQIAKDCGITTGLSAQEYVNARTLFILIKNSLTVPKLEPTSIGDNNTDWEIMDGTGAKDYSVLLGDRNIYIATGVVMEVYGNEAYVMITEDSQDWEFESGDEISFNVNGSDIGDYLFQNVNIYTEEISRRNYNVIDVMPSAVGEALVLDSDMVESVNDTQLSYYTEGSSKKTIKHNIEIIVYNGSNVSYDMTLAEIVTLGDVSLKFIENTGDTKYDVLIAEKYTYAPVDEVDAQNGIIIIDGNEVYLELEDEGINIELTNSKGTTLSLNDFVAGDTVAYVSDGKNPGAYSEYLKIVNLYDNMIKGTVNSLDAVNGLEYVIIDGVSYQNNSGITFEVGTEYTFCIGMTGKIVFGNTITEIVPRPEPEPEPVPTPEEAPQTVNFPSNVSLLSQLGIMNVNGLEKAEADRKITGAEFAAVLTKMAGFEAEAELFKGENTFNDVPADHWAAGYINLMAEKGAFAGDADGNFCPDETIDYAAAVNGVVRMLGFEPMVKVLGDNPVSYFKIGKNYGITDNIVPGVSLTADTFAMLAVNALNSPIMEITGVFDEGASWEVMDGKSSIYYRTLLTDMNIFIATGVVGEKDAGSISFMVTEDSDDWEFECGDGYEFNINGSDILDYQFQLVDVYVQETSKNTYNVIAVVPNAAGNTINLTSNDVKSASMDTLEYYVDLENSTKTQSIKLDLNGVMYNKMLYEYSLNDIISMDDVELTFIENTGDSRYDVLVATKYTYEYLEYVDPDKNKIILGGRSIELDFENEEMVYVFKDDAGNKLKLSDFFEGDVVAYYGDCTKLQDAYYIELVKIKNNTITGEIESLISSNGYEYIEIDGKKYINNSALEFEFGETYKFYIGVTGRIVYGDTDLSSGDGSEGDDSGDDSEGDGAVDTIPAQTVNYAENVKLLSDFDIINVNGLENADPSHEVTNGELAAVLVKMLNLESEISSYDGVKLLDNSYSGHWAEDYIRLLIERGIIDSGDIDPDAQADYVFAVKSTMRVLGYEPRVRPNGGTDYRYIEIARYCGVTRDIEVSSVGLTADTFAVLVFNALNTPVMKAIELEDDEIVWEIFDGRLDREYETLLSRRSVYVATGVATEIVANEIRFIISEDSDDFEFEEGSELIFKDNGSDIVDYMFQNVNIYVHRDADNNYNIISVLPGPTGKVLTLNSNSVINVNSRYLEYYVDMNNSSETRQLKLDYDIAVYYNMQAGYTLEDVCFMDGVELKLIENTGNEAYDVVVATDYTYGMVDSVDADNNTITINDETVKLDTGNGEKTVILCDDKGNKLTLSDFERNDVVAVVSDIAGAYDYAYNDYIKIVKITKEPVTGVVEETYESNGEGYAVINGTEYLDTWGDFVVGDEGTFYINKYNHIISFKPNYTYGYILESAVSEAAFSEDTWQVKILTEDNDVIICDLADDAAYEYEEIYGGVIQWDDSVEAGTNFDAKRLIAYKINSKGEIRSFELVAYDGWQTFTGEYSKTFNTIGGNYLENDTAVFAIGSPDCDYLYSAGVDDLTDGMTYTGAFHVDNGRYISALVITSGDVMGSSKYNESKYGYILEGAYENGDSTDGWVLSLLSKDEGIVDLPVLPHAGDELDAKFPDGYIEWTDGAFNNYGLIKYKTNVGGYITSVEFAKNNGTLKAIADKQYDAGTQAIGDVTLEDDAVVFVINGDSARDAQVSDISCLKDEGVYSGIVFRDAKGDYVAFVVTKGEIFEIMYPDEEKCYGYIVETRPYAGDVITEWEMNILTPDEGIKCYTLSDVANIYYEKEYDGDVITSTTNLLDANRLVEYIVDKDGFIRTFVPMVNSEGVDYVTIAGEFSEDTITLGGRPIAEDAIIFINFDGEIITSVGTDYFENSRDYGGALYTDETGKCTIAIITAGNGLFDSTKGFAIVTKISTFDYKGDDALNVNYIQDETEGTLIFTDDSKSYSALDCFDFVVGTAFAFSATPAGVVNEYVTIAQINDDRAIELCDDIPDVFGSDTVFYGGYIANEDRKRTSKGEVIDLSNGESIVVTASTNKYTYNDAGRNIVIEIGDFLAEEAYYFMSEWNEYTPVIVKMFDGEVIDIYTSTQRQILEQ